MSVMDLGSYLGVDHRFFGPLRGGEKPGSSWSFGQHED